MIETINDAPVTIIAQFSDAGQAESARVKIEEMLTMAQNEVDALFAKQGGVAEAADVASIYSRYGFHNDIGWQYDVPIITSDDELYWELPEGLVAEEAELLLLALGAQAMTMGSMAGREFWREGFYPMAFMAVDDDDDFFDPAEDELSPRAMPDKKILH